MTFEPIGEVAPITHPAAAAPASPSLPLSVRPAIAGSAPGATAGRRSHPARRAGPRPGRRSTRQLRPHARPSGTASGASSGSRARSRRRPRSRRGSTTWTISASANDCSRGIPIACPTATAANSNVPRFDGPAGTAAASATPEAISAAWPIDSWSADRLADRRDREDRAATTRPRCRRSASTSVRGRPATASPSWSRRAEVLDPRPALDQRADPVGARQAVGDDPDRQDDDEQPGDGGPDEDRARDDAPDVQDEQRRRTRSRRQTTRSTTRSTTTVPSADVRLIPSRSPR